MNGEYNIGDRVLGNWTLTKQIGEDAFGRVFEAERDDFGQIYKAAIKIITMPYSCNEVESLISDGMDEESVSDYFKGLVGELVDEFSLMSHLKGNSNVVSYEDHSVEEFSNGIGWDIIIRMELLKPFLIYEQEVELTRGDVIKLGIDICHALELCQQHDIVHSAIKAESIFVSQNGDFKLGDFGMAHTLEKTTGGLSKKGTYTYMAPEIYRGESYSSNIDIYSLGIVLYRMLNDNRVPFIPPYPAPIKHSDREDALMKRISGAKIPFPKKADEHLAEIVLKACAYDPKDRYPSPKQMREELEAISSPHDFDEIINDEPEAESLDIPIYKSNSNIKESSSVDAITSFHDVINSPFFYFIFFPSLWSMSMHRKAIYDTFTSKGAKDCMEIILQACNAAFFPEQQKNTLMNVIGVTLVKDFIDENYSKLFTISLVNPDAKFYMLEIDFTDTDCQKMLNKVNKVFLICSMDFSHGQVFTLEYNQFLNQKFLCEVGENGLHNNFGIVTSSDVYTRLKEITYKWNKVVDNKKPLHHTKPWSKLWSLFNKSDNKHKTIHVPKVCCIFENSIHGSKGFDEIEHFCGDGEGYSWKDGKLSLCKCTGCGALLLSYSINFLPMVYDDDGVNYRYYFPVEGREEALEFIDKYIGQLGLCDSYKGQKIWYDGINRIWSN